MMNMASISLLKLPEGIPECTAITLLYIYIYICVCVFSYKI